MKNLLLTTIGLISFLLVSGQSKAPKGMELCSGGTYTSNTYSKTVSVAPFFISNEITNKEFREFYNHVKNSPQDTIYWIDYRIAKEEEYSGKSYIVKKTHKEIFPSLIDQKVWEENPELKKQFFNEKAEDLPMIGVTMEGARFYCIWKTDKVNRHNKKKGKDYEQDFRLPFEAEWEFAATVFNSSTTSSTKELLEIKPKKGITNLDCNVAEWVVQSMEINNSDKVIRGGSYKTKNGFEERDEISKNKSTDYIGFRIVQSRMTKEEE